MSVLFRQAAPASHVFRLTGAADPGLLPRVLDLFAKRGLVPRSVAADRRALPAGTMLIVEVAVDAMPQSVASHVAACLSGTVGVAAVTLAAPVTASGGLDRLESGAAEQHVDGLAIAG